MKENLHFKQSRLNYINNQKLNKNKKKKTHKISNSLYCRLVTSRNVLGQGSFLGIRVLR